MAEIKKTENPAVGCAALVVTAIIFIFGYRACSRQDAEQQRREEQGIQEQDAKDRAEAARLGISYDDYRAARFASNRAYAACKVAAEGRAKHDYKADFIPNSSWTVKGRIISITGHDLQMQNGFGVYGPVTYYCEWSMDTQEVRSLNLTED